MLVDRYLQEGRIRRFWLLAVLGDRLRRVVLAGAQAGVLRALFRVGDLTARS